MSLTGELLAFHEREEGYFSDPDLVQDKRLHMVIAARKMGTSTSLDRAVRIFPDSARVNILTSREGKLGDPLKYRTNLSEQALKNMIIDQTLVNYAIDPSTGEIFGSRPESYPKEHNFLHTMPSGVAQLKRAGFLEATETYMYMQPEAWEGVANTDGFNGQKKAAMESTIVSATYGLDNIETLNFVKNYIGRQDQTARDIAFVTIPKMPGYDKNEAEKDLKKLLAIAKDLAVRSE